VTGAETVMQRCDQLAACSEEADRITRPFGSGAMQKAHELVGHWILEAGMRVSRDNIGNVRGQYEADSPGRPTLLMGSHLDTIRGAGKYDGMLGVVLSIAAVQALHDVGRHLPFAIEVIAFADEEGLRFGSTYLGSRALAGSLAPSDLNLVDSHGVTLAQAITDFGGDPARISDDRWSNGELLGYVEPHIEQGPVLEARRIPVGVVSAIAGQNRYALTLQGEAGHAGTVPMNGRRDALAAAAEIVLSVEEAAVARPGLVATVGKLDVYPGATNVIPGHVDLSLDVRHADDATRIETCARILERAQDICAQRNVGVTVKAVADNAAVPCSPRLSELLARSVEDSGLEVLHLPSGAGHDGVAISSLTEFGMLFVRCKGGVSHSPAESVTVDDVEIAIDVLGRFLERLAATP
jgi:allantoate deiminase